MQKIILIIVGVAVVGGGIWYLSSNNSSTEEANTQIGEQHEEQMEENIESNEKFSGLGSLGNILGFGDNVRCEFKSTFEGMTSEGTFVTDGDRFRMEATMQDPESGEVTSNIINDSSYIYTWGTTAAGSMALKMPNTEVETDASADYSHTMSPDQSQVDFEQEVEYDCERWRVDANAFVPPSDIEFMNMEEMMREAMQDMPEGFELPEGFPAY